MLQVAWDKHCAIREEQRAGTALSMAPILTGATTAEKSVLLEHCEGVEKA